MYSHLTNKERYSMQKADLPFDDNLENPTESTDKELIDAYLILRKKYQDLLEKSAKDEQKVHLVSYILASVADKNPDKKFIVETDMGENYPDGHFIVKYQKETNKGTLIVDLNPSQKDCENLGCKK